MLDRDLVVFRLPCFFVRCFVVASFLGLFVHVYALNHVHSMMWWWYRDEEEEEDAVTVA